MPNEVPTHPASARAQEAPPLRPRELTVRGDRLPTTTIAAAWTVALGMTAGAVPLLAGRVMVTPLVQIAVVYLAGLLALSVIRAMWRQRAAQHAQNRFGQAAALLGAGAAVDRAAAAKVLGMLAAEHPAMTGDVLELLTDFVRHRSATARTDRPEAAVIDIEAAAREIARPAPDGIDPVAPHQLAGAALAWASLPGGRLPGVNLSAADLRHADLRAADLAGAAMRSADAGGIRLAGADLTGADLASARLGAADLTGTAIAGAQLQQADLTGAVLRAARAAGADLTGADLTDADLTDADLSGARMAQATLVSAVLDGVRLDGADLSGAALPWAALAGA
ncbi:MAG: pentapeptide repeat-containing protein, partial [Thermoleophilia bacterium]